MDEELFQVPPELAGDLRQEQSRPAAAHEVEAVTADFDFAVALHPPERREGGDLDRQPGEVLRRHRVEPRIAGRRLDGHVADGAPEGVDGADVPDAAAEMLLRPLPERYERAALFEEERVVRGGVGGGLPREMRRERLPGDSEEFASVGGGQHQGPV